MNLKDKLNELDFIAEALKTVNSLDAEVFIVGGFVRDLILDRKNQDIDFLVVGDALKFARELAANLGVEDVTVFKNFGTAHFNYKGLNFEFVASRKESYRKSSRKPDVSEGEWSVNTWS